MTPERQRVLDSLRQDYTVGTDRKTNPTDLRTITARCVRQAMTFLIAYDKLCAASGSVIDMFEPLARQITRNDCLILNRDQVDEVSRVITELALKCGRVSKEELEKQA